MAQEKAFRNMNELITALAKAERELAGGTLGVDGLETACIDARELYERLIVLRHKAREAAVASPVPVVAPAPTPTPVTTVGRPSGIDATVAPAPTAVPAPEPTSIRLDTRPPEPGPRQVSLIEAIEATEQEPAKAERPAPKPKAGAPALSGVEGPAPAPATAPAPAPAPAPTSSKPAPTLAEKLEHAAIPDLAKAISLSHKFWFVAELFNGDRITYDKSIDRLNAMPDGAAAQAFVQAEVIDKLRKPADPEALATFTELVKRRYA